MVKPVSRKVVAATALGVLAVPVALLSACSPNQPPATSPGTTPSVWTGSPPPASTPPKGGPGRPESLTTHLMSPTGVQVATAKFEFDNGFVTVTIETTGLGQLSPGFHGVHIHSVGKCEPNSVAPTGGAPGDFLSAGGHYQAPGHTGDPESGDLTSLQVRKDGAALLVTTTDAFTKEDLVSGDGSAIVIHEGADNFANIPPDRYTQVNGAPGPDQTTMATGDAGKRVACGVIGSG
ncbi:superoxide dismutase[Cu-Zn] [Mycobacterium branderi]|uniref:Superoxide dismutase [Cu-Zn] n=2 Tax=Mycobacterium branderi TaxID=43348 RepID=A0AA91LT24_9MYCO|nr:superoxide dismutase family protein [Mycobacterium branderi]MCV7236146.1 superoxide dismutase family protein [Mycobacterium branderi]ORA32030.1 superoxide dismutase [Mycobacterium branderi]